MQTCFKYILLVALGALVFNPTYASQRLNGKCGSKTYWQFDPETGALLITGEGAINEFKDGRRCPWNKYKGDITSVRIEEGVTSIGCFSFARCVKLTRVELPTSLTNISYRAFFYCIKLNSIALPQGLITHE